MPAARARSSPNASALEETTSTISIGPPGAWTPSIRL
jgi:hypothetical protein